MAYEHKESFGALFRNDKKESDKHPDYKGSIMLNGTVYEIAGWKKKGGKGTFLSLKGKEQGERQEKTSKRAESIQDDDPLPF